MEERSAQLHCAIHLTRNQTKSAEAGCGRRMHRMIQESTFVAQLIAFCLMSSFARFAVDELGLALLLGCFSSWGLQALVYAQLSSGPVAAFQSGWGLDLALTTSWLLFFISSDVLPIIVLLHNSFPAKLKLSKLDAFGNVSNLCLEDSQIITYPSLDLTADMRSFY